MGKGNKQAEAASHIRELLAQRGLDISSRKMSLPDSQQWVIFELNQRQIGIDSVSGVWVRESIRHDWRCIAMPCSVSGALQTVEFLTSD
jgi:hypothetical protein